LNDSVSLYTSVTSGGGGGGGSGDDEDLLFSFSFRRSGQEKYEITKK
jgi:hypothetical protein